MANTTDQNLYTATPWDRDFWIIEESARVRCFLIIGSSDAMLVDTGLGQGDLREFVSTLTQLPIFVVNTHADIDHTGCNTQFEDVYMHPSDFFYHRARVNAPLSVKPIWDKDIITVGGRPFEVVHLPGHTPGSIALLDRENRLLIAGDSVNLAPIHMFGNGGRDLSAFLCSMQKLDGLSDCFSTVLPSHGTLPLTPSLIGELYEGGTKVLSGEIEGRPAPRADCLLYEYKSVKFLY
jgi:glyoxylase-like metal-dependent hydrolase (beta-lactamase superfamily II)